MAPRLRTLGLTVPVSEVLNADLWKQRYAHGVVLGLERQNLGSVIAACQQQGDTSPAAIKAMQKVMGSVVNEIPSDTIRWHLKCALSELEMKLGIPMGVVICKADPTGNDSITPQAALEAEGFQLGVNYDKIVSRRPYTQGEAHTWYKIDIPSSVISVERVRAYYYGNLIWEMSEDRGNINQVRIEWPRQGMLHILPINFQSLVVTNAGGNYGVWNLIHAQRTPMPDFWAVDYTIGPVTNQTGEVGQIEAVLADWVYAAAGIKIMSLAGLAKSQGLASTSTSFDGFSRSVSLQASAIYGLNSAFENILGEALKRINWKEIKMAKKGLRIRPYGY